MIQFLGLPAGEYTFQTAHVIVIPVPFEASVSYGTGTAQGPSAILNASCQIEFWDEWIKSDYTSFGIYTVDAMPDGSTVDRMSEFVFQTVVQCLQHQKFPVVLGGEHTIAVPAVAAFASVYPGGTVIHFDAHADLRDEYQDNRNSHACALRRIRETGVRTLSIGIRSCSKEESDYARQESILLLHPESPSFQNELTANISQISGPIWITFDIDGLDPALMPATGTPEPGGLSWKQVMDIFLLIKNANRYVIGCDIVELAPVKQLHHADFTAAKLAYRMMLLYAQKRSN